MKKNNTILLDGDLVNSSGDPISVPNQVFDTDGINSGDCTPGFYHNNYYVHADLNDFYPPYTTTDIVFDQPKLVEIEKVSNCFIVKYDNKIYVFQKSKYLIAFLGENIKDE